MAPKPPGLIDRGPTEEPSFISSHIPLLTEDFGRRGAFQPNTKTFRGEAGGMAGASRRHSMTLPRQPVQNTYFLSGGGTAAKEIPNSEIFHSPLLQKVDQFYRAKDRERPGGLPSNLATGSTLQITNGTVRRNVSSLGISSLGGGYENGINVQQPSFTTNLHQAIDKPVFGSWRRNVNSAAAIGGSGHRRLSLNIGEDNRHFENSLNDWRFGEKAKFMPKSNYTSIFKSEEYQPPWLATRGEIDDKTIPAPFDSKVLSTGIGPNSPILGPFSGEDQSTQRASFRTFSPRAYSSYGDLSGGFSSPAAKWNSPPDNGRNLNNNWSQISPSSPDQILDRFQTAKEVTPPRVQGLNSEIAEHSSAIAKIIQEIEDIRRSSVEVETPPKNINPEPPLVKKFSTTQTQKRPVVKQFAKSPSLSPPLRRSFRRRDGDVGETSPISSIDHYRSMDSGPANFGGHPPISQFRNWQPDRNFQTLPFATGSNKPISNVDKKPNQGFVNTNVEKDSIYQPNYQPRKTDISKNIGRTPKPSNLPNKTANNTGLRHNDSQFETLQDLFQRDLDAFQTSLPPFGLPQTSPGAQQRVAPHKFGGPRMDGLLRMNYLSRSEGDLEEAVASRDIHPRKTVPTGIGHSRPYAAGDKRNSDANSSADEYTKENHPRGRSHAIYYDGRRVNGKYDTLQSDKNGRPSDQKGNSLLGSHPGHDQVSKHRQSSDNGDLVARNSSQRSDATLRNKQSDKTGNGKRKRSSKRTVSNADVPDGSREPFQHHWDPRPQRAVSAKGPKGKESFPVDSGPVSRTGLKPDSRPYGNQMMMMNDNEDSHFRPKYGSTAGQNELTPIKVKNLFSTLERSQQQNDRDLQGASSPEIVEGSKMSANREHSANFSPAKPNKSRTGGSRLIIPISGADQPQREISQRRTNSERSGRSVQRADGAYGSIGRNYTPGKTTTYADRENYSPGRDNTYASGPISTNTRYNNYSPPIRTGRNPNYNNDHSHSSGMESSGQNHITGRNNINTVHHSPNRFDERNRNPTYGQIHTAGKTANSIDRKNPTHAKTIYIEPVNYVQNQLMGGGARDSANHNWATNESIQYGSQSALDSTPNGRKNLRKRVQFEDQVESLGETGNKKGSLGRNSGAKNATNDYHKTSQGKQNTFEKLKNGTLGRLKK